MGEARDAQRIRISADIRGRIRINGYGYGIVSFWTDTDIEAYPYPFIRIFCALDKMASTA